MSFLIHFEAQAQDVFERELAAAGEEDAERGIARQFDAVVGQRQHYLKRRDKINDAAGHHRTDLAETEAVRKFCRAPGNVEPLAEQTELDRFHGEPTPERFAILLERRLLLGANLRNQIDRTSQQITRYR